MGGEEVWSLWGNEICLYTNMENLAHISEHQVTPNEQKINKFNFPSVNSIGRT